MIANRRIRVSRLQGDRASNGKSTVPDYELKTVRTIDPGQIQIIKAPLTSRPEGNSKHLTFVPKDAADKNYRIIFETTFDRVREFRSGKLPEVEFLEGCL